mmetsp:Transcript_8732/g.18888  ORF Transcript_8732/g.18888 Transcript_8732/m.18888 type:complete len:395 (+) Transcript_8732:109-1293(+)
MPYVGLSSTVRDDAASQKTYDWVKAYQLPFAIQNAWKQPYAKTYVAKLIAEAPDKSVVKPGKLAVVTGVTIGGAGYHMAEELALQGGFHVILLGRNEGKLKAAIESIEKEAIKRKVDKPTLYESKFDLNALSSAKAAADLFTELAETKYDGQLCVLLNNAGAVSAKPRLTADGIEANVGWNFIATHYFTDLLLPVLKEAASPTYKPRVVDVASIAHIFAGDLSPDRLSEFPKQSGAPEGRIGENDDGTISFLISDMEGPKDCYGRSKMGTVAITKYIQTLHPEINFVALHPGSIASNFGGDMGAVAKVYYWGFYAFQYVPSQGAVAALRASLDPDFNSEADLQGAYLHCDGNPWTPCHPEAMDPTTKAPYAMEEYGKALMEAADKIIAKVVGQA